MTRRILAVVLALAVFQWSMMTNAPAQLVHWFMSTTSAIAQASGTVASGLANQIAYYASSGTTVQGLAIVTNSVPSYDGSGVLGNRTTLPSSLTIPSPVVTGVGTAPTATCGTNSAQFATTQFAKNCIPQIASIGWLVGVNPNGGILLVHAPQALTVSSLYCRLTANGDSGATISVYTAPSGIGGTNGTLIASAGCNLNTGTLNADQQMTLAATNISAGNSVYVVTTGVVTLSSGAIGMNAIYQ